MALPKGKGIGVMIALGKPGAPPPRYKSQSDSTPAPDEKGGGPEAPQERDPDAGRPEQNVTISPEAVDYHDGSENCGNCEYLSGDQCRVLKMPVDAHGGHCEAWEAKGDSDQGAPDMMEHMAQ